MRERFVVYVLTVGHPFFSGCNQQRKKSSTMAFGLWLLTLDVHVEARGKKERIRQIHLFLKPSN